MILTGKCKEDFLKSKYFPSNGEVYFNDLPESCKNALIIDFFDSTGIYININNLDHQSWWYYNVKLFPNNYECKILKRTSQEATTEAIKKSNEIYNKNNNEKINPKSQIS